MTLIVRQTGKPREASTPNCSMQRYSSRQRVKLRQHEWGHEAFWQNTPAHGNAAEVSDQFCEKRTAELML